MRIPKGHNFVPTYSGELYHTIYRAKVKANGELDLVEDGKEDIKEKINSFRDTTDMQYILRQMALGNTSVLLKSPGDYGDFTGMPKTMAEAMQLQIDAERAFYDLPLDIRNNFDNDVHRWLSTAGDEEWAKKMNFVKDNIDDTVKEGDTVVS